MMGSASTGVGILRRIWIGRVTGGAAYTANKAIPGSFRNRGTRSLSTLVSPQFQTQNSQRATTATTRLSGFDVQSAPAVVPVATPRRGFSSTNMEPDDDGVVTNKLRALIVDGGIQADPHQLRASRELDRLYNELVASEPPPDPGPEASSGGFLSGLFGDLSSTFRNASTPKGIYTYGGVGCGKTFLMELFFKALDDEPSWAQEKQIVHYHKFMLNVHQFMHTSKQEQKEAGITDGNPIDAVVDHILKSGRLLCLDEFQVTDVADAMILKELFGKLWKKGCILVTTSNRPPRDLYLNGLQRDRFLPFVDLLEEKCTVVSLMENETDYRMVISARDNQEEEEDDDDDTQEGEESVSTNSTISTRRAKQVYFCGRDQKKVLQKLFYERARGRPTNPSTLETQGRKVKIPMACKAKSVCMFSFEDLCQKALGAADYLVIGQHFSTIFVYGVPEMTVHEINWLRRFITFVDSMYEWKVRVLLQTNAATIEEIFCVDDKESYQQDEVFAFDRTRSRLEEMSSTQYLSSQWLGGDKETTSIATTTLDLEPSLADQWFQLVVGSGGLEETELPNKRSERATDHYNHDGDDEESFSKELFDRLDANSDGFLDQEEIKALMTDAFGYEPVDVVVKEMIASVDTDQNGMIDLDEFKALLAEIRNHGKNSSSNKKTTSG